MKISMKIISNFPSNFENINNYRENGEFQIFVKKKLSGKDSLRLERAHSGGGDGAHPL